MKIATNVVTTSTNIQGAGTEVGFDPEAFGHIMSILSNMYSDIALAVIREYSANAYDSHMAAGVTDPIEVSLPTTLNPTYIVKDKGLGLSKDQIINVYGRYGKSTKRDDNGQIGGFGIGAKAAFALGHQFVVTGVKDGQKVVVLFALNARNVGEMKVVHEQATDEPNGVTVSMAVEDIDDFNAKANVFFSKWAPGTVLVDGAQPESVYDDAQEINAQCHVVSQHQGSVWLTMGQIAYPVSDNIIGKAATVLRERGDQEGYDLAQSLRRWYNDSALFFHGEIGSAEIAPTREALMDTGVTVETLADLIATVPTTLLQSVQETVKEAATGAEAAKALHRLKAEVAPLKFDANAVTWKGMPLPAQVNVEGAWLVADKKSRRATRTYASGRSSVTVKAGELDKIVLIPNVTAEQSASIRRFATRFLNTSKYEQILLGAEDVTDVSYKWFNYDAVDHMTFEEYKGFLKALPKAPREANEPAYSLNTTSYDRERYSRTVLSEIVDEGLDLIVFHDTVYLSSLEWAAIKGIYNVVVLGPSQTEEALVKHLTKIEADIEIVDRPTWRAVVTKHAESLYNATDAEKAALGARQWLQANQYEIEKYRTAYAVLGKSGEVTNQTFVDIIEYYEIATLVAADITNVRISQLEQAAKVLANNGDMVTKFDVVVPEYAKAFPLLDSLSYRSLRDNKQVREQALAFVNSL